MTGARLQMTAARGLAHEAALAEVVPALRAAGVTPLLIKGPATIRLIYDDPNGRDSDDIDLLVEPSAFERAIEVLRSHGFASKFDGAREGEHLAYEETLRRTGPLPVMIDLHRALPLVSDGARLYAVLSRGTHTLKMGAFEIQIPSDGASALIIALHVAQHGTQVGRPLEDLRLACGRLDRSVWAEAAAMAAELGVTESFALGLGQLPEGTAIVESLELDLVDPNLEARFRLREGSVPMYWLLVAIRRRDLGAALVAIRNGLAPSPAALRAYYPDIAPGRRALAAAYARRAALLPSNLIDVISAVNQSRPRRLLGYVRALSWSLRACRVARRQLRAGGLDAVGLRRAPTQAPGTTRGVIHGLGLARPSCLERSLVRREWHLAQGRDIPIVIGVRTAPDMQFGAHAWLQGDPPDPGDFAEIAVWPGDRAVGAR